uniref:Uncharacterized protein n=1 Tax=Macaca fascicularis TaxID=9541 RepID=Q9GMM7_MACFA|nr:hypothetical protein [Macaca fascicularis]
MINAQYKVKCLLQSYCLLRHYCQHQNTDLKKELHSEISSVAGGKELKWVDHRKWE